MLLTISYTERGAAAKRSQARTRSNQQETGQQNLLFDEINVVLVSIGSLLTFVTLVVAVLQWQQYRQRHRSNGHIESSAESGIGLAMGSVGSFMAARVLGMCSMLMKHRTNSSRVQ